jgi:UTP--glucose-1-phosphate uridylyltransferase
MIRNNKTVDPRDKTSPGVIQLEIAMGAAIECFAGSSAIEVPRSRFAPVKTTGDLLALRSDAYEVLPDGQVRLHASRNGKPPVIALSDDYKLVDQIEALGVPSLIGCNSLKIDGPIKIAPGVKIEGDVEVKNSSSERKYLQAGHYKDLAIEL